MIYACEVVENRNWWLDRLSGSPVYRRYTGAAFASSEEDERQHPDRHEHCRLANHYSHGVRRLPALSSPHLFDSSGNLFRV